MVNKDKTSPEYKEEMTNPTEFNLSEKIFGEKDWKDTPEGYLKVKDVKEAIRLLKELNLSCGRGDLLRKEIDKLAGKNLK